MSSWGKTEACKAYKKAYYQANKVEILKKQAIRYAQNPQKGVEKQRKRHLTKFFPGLTPEEAALKYLQLYHSQNGVCAICAKPETKRDTQQGKVCNLAVDHCHVTGKVRGLLCFICNTNLGRFENALDKVLRYLGK